MKKYENNCVSCPPEIGCLGKTCPKRNELHFYCDKCKDEAPLFHFDGGEYCIDCIKEMLDSVEGSDF